MRRLVIALAVVALAAVTVAGLTDGRGADDGRTALAIQGVDTIGFSGLPHLVVECAEDVTVEIGTDAGGSGLPQVTVWGHPTVGRCTPPVLLSIEQSEVLGQKFVDGATSQVVEVGADQPTG